MDSNKGALLQISVALLIVQCSFADSNVKRRAIGRFDNTSSVMGQTLALPFFVLWPLFSNRLTASGLHLQKGHSISSSDNYDLRHVKIELAA